AAHDRPGGQRPLFPQVTLVLLQDRVDRTIEVARCNELRWPAVLDECEEPVNTAPFSLSPADRVPGTMAMLAAELLQLCSKVPREILRSYRFRGYPCSAQVTEEAVDVIKVFCAADARETCIDQMGPKPGQ